jgi:peptidylprolyl isomerase
MAVKEGDTVKVNYTGTFDDGQVFDSTDMHDGEPLEFTVGQHQVVPGFENAVIGKEVGKEFSIRLEPKDAYGEPNPQAVGEIPADQLPEDFKPEVGMIIAVGQQHGDHTHQIPAKITEVSEKGITIDLNHPMAGKTLNFKMVVVEIVE